MNLRDAVKTNAEWSDGAILLTGCGNMGGAMLAGWVKHGMPAHLVTVVDPSLPATPDGIRVLASVPSDLPPPSIMVLAVKPQMLTEAAVAYAPLTGPETLLVSVLAAVDISTLRSLFPGARAVVRAVPNLPGAIGSGVTALAGDELDDRTRGLSQKLFAPLGHIEWLDREALCDAATSVSGCGPAFLFRFAEAVVAAGQAQGLPRDQALRLIATTMVGAGHMLGATTADPATMVRRVASPGGVTLAGLRILDGPGGLRELMAATLEAATARSAEMAELVRAVDA